MTLKSSLTSLTGLLSLIAAVSCSDGRPVQSDQNITDFSKDSISQIDTSLDSYLDIGVDMKPDLTSDTNPDSTPDSSPDTQAWIFPDNFDVTKITPKKNKVFIYGDEVMVTAVIPKMTGTNNKLEDVKWEFTLTYNNTEHILISGYLAAARTNEKDRKEKYELETDKLIEGANIYLTPGKIINNYYVYSSKNLLAFKKTSITWNLQWPDKPVVDGCVIEDAVVGKKLKIKCYGKDPFGKGKPTWNLKYSDIKSAVMDPVTGTITTPQPLIKKQDNLQVDMRLIRKNDSSKEGKFDLEFEVDKVSNQLNIYDGSKLLIQMGMSSDTTSDIWNSCSGACGIPSYKSDTKQNLITADCSSSNASQVPKLIGSFYQELSSKKSGLDLRATKPNFALINQQTSKLYNQLNSLCTTYPKLRIENKTN